VRTTVPAIAERASVSRATVFNSVGTKAEVLRACYDAAVVGDDEPLPLYARPEMLAMLAEPDPRLALDLYAAIICGVGARVSPLVEVLRAASAADDDIRIMWQQIQSERLYGATRFVQTLAGKTPLRPGLTQAKAADLVWTLIDNSLYHRLVLERGWPPEEFQQWLSSTFIEQLLPQ
jgi:AcrR family transcriptional regulator